MAVSGFGDRTAFGSVGSGLTYTELLERSARAGHYFTEAGTDRVSFLDVSSPALPVALFGAAYAGQPFVPLNYRLADGDLAALAERTAPASLVAGTDQVARVASTAGLQVIERDEFLSATESGDALDPSAWSMDPDDIAVLLYTSGTTGEPKAAVLRHKNLVGYILGSVEFMGAGEDEATLVSVPPYHIAGLAAILSSVYAGRRVVQLPNFDADTWIDLVASEGVTHAMVVPTMLARIVEQMTARSIELPSLRALSYGGGRMPLPVIDQALRLFPETRFVNAYGLTETSSTISLLGPDDHRQAHVSDDPSIQRRLTTTSYARGLDSRRRRRRSPVRYPRRGLGPRRTSSGRVSPARLQAHGRRLVPNQRRRRTRCPWVLVCDRSTRRCHRARWREHFAR
jgi:acyl-CoA synthetase (AMP-forming)/AMP-acid ligase II